MCDSWQKEPMNELGVDEIGNIFEQLPPMDAVRLTGGEPFLRKDLLDITHLAQDKLRPIYMHITTNGIATDHIIQFCEERIKNTKLYLLVSVDGMEEKHNQIRRHRDAWARAIETIRELAPRQKELKINISVNQTIVDTEGVEQYRQLKDLLDRYKVPVHVVVAYKDSATYSLESEIDLAPKHPGEFVPFGEFSDTEFENLLTTLKANLKKHTFYEQLGKRYYLFGIQNRLLRKDSQPNPKCVALNSHIRLLPDGQVPICQFNTQCVGNLSDQSFEAVWFGLSATKQRAWIRRCPGCWAECEILPNAIYSGDLIKFSLVPRWIYRKVNLNESI
jgi:MoaA/NifB/PqqE/SkfB family radical SAM enzyme